MLFLKRHGTNGAAAGLDGSKHITGAHFGMYSYSQTSPMVAK